MSLTNPREIQAALAQPFAPEDVEWRLQMALEDQMRGMAVPYLTNRAIQNRLDEVVGIENWRNAYTPWHSAGKKDAQICGISLYFEGSGWVTKWDGAEDTDIEPVKGGLSDSMKRAAVHWGIGRALYSMDPVWVEIEKKGRSVVIKDTMLPKLDSTYRTMLRKAGFVPPAPTGAQSQPPPAQAPIPLPSTEKSAAVPEPPYEYTVKTVKVQAGMNGKSTSLTLTDRTGKDLPAFANGEFAELVPGVRLKNVTLTRRMQSTVVFFTLDRFEVVNPTKEAA